MVPSGDLEFLEPVCSATDRGSAEVTVPLRPCQAPLETTIHRAPVNTIPRERAAPFGSL